MHKTITISLDSELAEKAKYFARVNYYPFSRLVAISLDKFIGQEQGVNK